ncbi:unnamed protein product [Owenia fusiformis]|uniref:Peptidase S1 domain-containing protein n=1 Tax=Owenia fusiformis TaxID=6347 RepID=A0A8S4NCG6_OWEFU|nr:unnamed protein product [Owenia fusiformis]
MAFAYDIELMIVILLSGMSLPTDADSVVLSASTCSSTSEFKNHIRSQYKQIHVIRGRIIKNYPSEISQEESEASENGKPSTDGTVKYKQRVNIIKILEELENTTRAILDNMSESFVTTKLEAFEELVKDAIKFFNKLDKIRSKHLKSINKRLKVVQRKPGVSESSELNPADILRDLINGQNEGRLNIFEGKILTETKLRVNLYMDGLQSKKSKKQRNAWRKILKDMRALEKLKIGIQQKTKDIGEFRLVDEMYLFYECEKNCSIQAVKPRAIVAKIHRGEEATPHSWPWMVRFDKYGNHWCGGTLLKPNIVVSAAHCFVRPIDTRIYDVYLGSHARSKPTSSEQKFSIEEIYIHPIYDEEHRDRRARGFNHDIAIVKLNGSVQYNKHIQPCCLADQSPVENGNCIATGWGKTEKHVRSDVLMQAYLPMLNIERCQKMLPEHINTAYMTCAGSYSLGKDTCQGDSGGPLVCTFDDVPIYKLSGITSFGQINCGESFGAYTNVSYYLDWIENTLEQLESGGNVNTVATSTPTTPLDSKTKQTTLTSTIPTGSVACGTQVFKPQFASKSRLGRREVTRRKRIVGGIEAVPHSWPWVVHFDDFSGAGSLYKPDIVITSATVAKRILSHNIDTVSVVVGAHNISLNESTKVKIKSIVLHQDYSSKYDNDIAIVKLERRVSYTNEIRPVCLPDATPKSKTVCVVTGWGVTQEPDEPSRETLRQVKLPILKTSDCNKRHRYNGAITKNMFCAGYFMGDHDTCTGDGGGPLVCKNRQTGQYHMVGLVSWGSGLRCGLMDNPTVYTNVFMYNAWIEKTIEEMV